MNLPLIILCSGQGGQHARMFDLARQRPLVAQWLAQIDEQNILGQKLDAVLANAENLFDNTLAQPLVVMATMANWLALNAELSKSSSATDLGAEVRDENLPNFLLKPTMTVGYSIGEVSAHAVSGSLAATTAVALAKQRAALMQACVEKGMPHGMLAVSGIAIHELKNLLTPLNLHVAIVINEDRCLIAGLEKNIHAALELLSQRAICTKVPVNIASHTPLMDSATRQLDDLLNTYQFDPTDQTTLAGVDAHRVMSVADIKTSLVAQLNQPIRWDECMDQCAESGAQFALEIGPGNALSRMLRERHPHIETRAVDDFRSLTGVASWLQRKL